MTDEKPPQTTDSVSSVNTETNDNSVNSADAKKDTAITTMSKETTEKVIVKKSSTEKTNAKKSTEKSAKKGSENNSKKTNKNSDEVAPKKTDVKKVKPAPRKRGILRSLVVFLICLIVIAAAGYFAWQFWLVQQARISEIETQLEQQSTQWQSSASQQSSLLAQQQQNLTEVNSAFTQEQKILQQRLDAQANRLSHLSGKRRDGWMLEEARYLLRLANQRQLTGGGVNGILGLLASADDTLRELDNPDLFPIRDSIRKEMIALKLSPQIDREGIYLSLLALSEQINQLPAAPLTSTLPKFVKEDVVITEDMPWQDRVLISIRNTFGHLDNYVRITRSEDVVTPELSEIQQNRMSQNLRLMIDQAQIALLREEEKIYQASLKKVIVWLHTHYSHYPEKTPLVEEIRYLQQQPIVGVLPDVSTSLLRLNDFIASQSVSSDNKAQPQQDTAL